LFSRNTQLTALSRVAVVPQANGLGKLYEMLFDFATIVRRIEVSFGMKTSVPWCELQDFTSVPCGKMA